MSFLLLLLKKKNNSIHQINRVTANRSHDQLHKTTPSNPHATNHAARLLTKLVAWNIVIKVFSQKIERYKDRIRHLLRWRYCMRPGSGTGSSSLAGVLGDGVFWVLFLLRYLQMFSWHYIFFLQKGRRQSENSLRASHVISMTSQPLIAWPRNSLCQRLRGSRLDEKGCTLGNLR